MNGFVTKANTFIEKWMQVIMPLCVLAGFFLGDRLSIINRYNSLLFAFACFASSLTVSLSEFRKAFNLKALIVMMFAGHIILPVISALLFRLVASPTSDLFAGLMLIFAGPCATTSYIWSGIYGGNKGLSIVFVVVDTFVSILIMPLIMKLACSSSVAIDSIALIKSMIFMVVIPSILGVLFATVVKKEKMAPAVPLIKFVTKISLLLIITATIGGFAGEVSSSISWDYLLSMIIVFVLLVFGYALGFFANRYIIRSDISDAISLAFSLGCRNVGLAIIMANRYFRPMAALAPVVCLFFHDVVTANVGKFFLRLRAKTEDVKNNSEEVRYVQNWRSDKECNRTDSCS